ncbi:MAG: DUF1674 domain-containing protein [Pseudomonadota bacterium]
MTKDDTSPTLTDTGPGQPDENPQSDAGPDLPPAAKRALQEAEERRQAAAKARGKAPREIDGRGGLDPVRYGDWEVKGLTSDF